MYFSKTIFSLKHIFNAGIGFTSSYHFLSLKLLQLYYYHYSNVVTRTEHKTLNSLPESYIIREQWMNVVNFKCKIINQLQWWQKPFVTCHNLLSKTFKPISHAEQSVINYDFFFLLKWSYNYDSWILVLRNKVAFNSLRTNDTHKRTVNYSQLQKKKGRG